MHCLNLKLTADFNTASFLGRVGSRVKECNFRVNRIVACAVPGSGLGSDQDPSCGSQLSRSETYELLKQQLEVAKKFEDYKEAARVRDSLRLFEEEEPFFRVQRLLKEAISEERFEGINVKVRSVYIGCRSQPSKGVYFFSYRIRIFNQSNRPVQLLRRHWIITDGCGRTEIVQGNGVIGEQPVILPKTGFEYTSACPMSTSSGKMEGNFEMKHIDKVGARPFIVAIAPFALSRFEDATDAV